MIPKFFRENENRLKWYGVLISLGICLSLSALFIYTLGEYGIALFLIVPTLIGAIPTLVVKNEIEVTRRISNSMAFNALGLFAVVLFFARMEGIICIVMCAPLGMLGAWIGANFARYYTKPNRLPPLIVLIAATLGTGFAEHELTEPNVEEVTTSVIINAKIETVWKNVIEFPELEEPEEILFNAGIAYPISAEIEGNGVGAIRHCNFSTGSFVEPITVWDQPNLLAFHVDQCPEPMTELSFWDVDAPHLHDYFVSQKGQFKLTAISETQTKLEGTTWYAHRIRPEFYWQLWSNHIVHQIHERVLNHIKDNSETESAEGV